MMASDDQSYESLSPGSDGEVPDDLDEYIDNVGEKLRRGKLPLRVYNDEEIHRAELRRIFGQEWIFIGHETEIPENGDYVRRHIAEDPFIFNRDKQGEIHVLFDSCRHRGPKVCRADRGNTSHFRCPYHGWTFKNNGELVGIPQRDCFEGLEEEDWGLMEAPRVANYKGLVFASLSEEGPSIEEYLGDFKWYLDIHLDLTDGGMEVIGEPFRYTIESNWKLGAENFAGDGYHTQSTHHSAVDTFVEMEWSWHGERDYEFISDIDGYYNGTYLMGLFEDTDAFWGYPEQITKHITRENLSDEQYDIARRSAVHVSTIFPNFSIHHQAGSPPTVGHPLGFLSLRKWIPKGPGETEVLNLILAPKEASEEWKERIHETAVYTFSPSGNFVQDDVAVWSGVNEAAGSLFAEKEEVDLAYKAGIDGVGDADPDESFPGPGFASRTFHEGYARTLHKNWHKAMTENN